MQILKKREVDLALLLVAAFWGGSYLAAKELTEHTSVVALLAIRFSITSIAMFAIWTIKRTSITRSEALLGLGLGSVQALILFFETSGVARTSATNEISELISKKINAVTGNQITKSSTKSNIDIQIINETELGKEGYHLDVNEKGIQIKANTNAGLFYAWQSLLQIMPTAVFNNTVQNNISWKIPYVSITDKPRFGWRGLMLDVSRHFFTKAEVKEYIDNMVLYKYNVLHLHLTDDQGWRIEIKALPKLTEVGAWRAARGKNGDWWPAPPDRQRAPTPRPRPE